MKRDLLHGLLVLLLCSNQILAKPLIIREEISPYKFRLTPTLAGISLILCCNLLKQNPSPYSKSEILLFQRNSVNSFDRSATYQWDEKAQKASYIAKDLANTLPLFMVIPPLCKGEYKNAAMWAFMYAEGFYLTDGITELTKGWVSRTRPYMYNSNLSPDKKLELGSGSDSRKSFFSGHSSAAFYSAVFVSTTFQEIYGPSTVSKCVWGVSLSLATATACLRYKGGMHYPTDLLAGALSGSLIGYLVPYMYKKKHTKFNVSIAPQTLRILYSFN